MKKSILSAISLLLTLVMLLGALSACSPKDNDSTTDTTSTNAAEGTESENNSGSSTESNVSSESSSESESESNSEDETDSADSLSGEHGPLIEHSNELANGVQAYFTDSSRSHFTIKNLEMSMNYNRFSDGKQMVESIKNTSGKSYVENTMDVFIRMTDGKTFYASASQKAAEANLYRFGYYYYQGLFEYQNFIPSSFDYEVEKSASTRNPLINGVKAKKTGKGVAWVTTGDDPYIKYNDLSFDHTVYNSVVFTATVVGNLSICDIYIMTTENEYDEDRRTSIAVTPDGESHTYYVPLSKMNIEGDITGIRIDFANASQGDGLMLEELKMVKADLESVPSNVSINRHFHVYSDKMHHAVQFAVTAVTEDIAEIGMLTEIQADTVDKIIVVDKNGNHDSLDKIDWASVQCIGFDIKNVGIFGFILPPIEEAGSINVALKDGKYVIEQSRVPEDNTIYPSAGVVKDANGNLTHAEGVVNNGNDVYLGQRVYTDENHDFEEFLFENWCEQNPLSGKSFKVSQANSDGATFAGYDALRGIYVIDIAAPIGGFNTAYNCPQKNYKANFTVSSNVDRSIYVMDSNTVSGILECAVLLDENLLHLPVPIEVIKNFSEPDGERNLFNIDDPAFSEAIFTLTLKAGEKHEYSIVNLYQNWGKYPLKQISQIPFHCPYYHLSTGTTETNCIVPWFQTAPSGKVTYFTLPDFRSMSAPFWKGQPQHNSCGTDEWLQYTDTDGRFISVENVSDYIDSYGPTYAEVKMEKVSDDNKLKVTYTHMEMPQLDENRTYYTMDIEVLEDLTIEDFKHNFQLFSFSDNEKTGVYQRIGYLDKDNKCAVAPAVKTDAEIKEYVLGTACPYFSMFEMPGAYDAETNPEGYSNTSAEGYANVAFLVYNSSFVIDGKEASPNFAIINTNKTVKLTLDLESVTFKAGDRMTVNCILLPWGSQEMDGTYDEILDKNVRDVRNNTLLKPLTATSETDEIIESPFLPRIKSKDGKSAEFTLSGGHDNVAVRVYGFDMLTAPVIEEFVNGKWIPYEVNSASDKDNPAYLGYYHYYDGYCVYYDGDGSYSYSFVTKMDNGEPRKFRITADKEFDHWPADVAPEVAPNIIKVYQDASELNEIFKIASSDFSFSTLSEDGKYVTVSPIINVEHGESYATVYNAKSNDHESGQYFIMKYRVPSTNKEKLHPMEIFTSTYNTGATQGDNFIFDAVQDGEWHVLVIDLTAQEINTFKPVDGKYCTKYMRIDLFNKKFNTEVKLDIEYIGFESSLEELCKINSDVETITLLTGKDYSEISTTTYKPVIKTYLDPESGYTEATDIPFRAFLDNVSGIAAKKESSSAAKEISIVTDTTVTADLYLVPAGWCVAEGGIAKYVWSVDGGKTWNDIKNPDQLKLATEEIITYGASCIGKDFTFKDAEATKINGNFQGTGVVIDLSAYADKTVDVVLAAVPRGDASKLILLYSFEDISVKKATSDDSGATDKTESVLDPESVRKTSNTMFGCWLDHAKCDSNIKPLGIGAGNVGGFTTYSEKLTVGADNCVYIGGWCVTDGGTQKYVWSADKGKTWNDFSGTLLTPTGANGDAIFNAGNNNTGNAIIDKESSLVNASFQGANAIKMDLSAYTDSTEPLEIIVGAVPVKDHENVCILYVFTNISMAD